MAPDWRPWLQYLSVWRSRAVYNEAAAVVEHLERCFLLKG